MTNPNSEIEPIQRELEVDGTKVLLDSDGSIKEPPIGSVIKLSGRHTQFGGAASPIRYDYAAIRAGNGRWYTTGSSCPISGYSWQGLLDFITKFIDPRGERLC